MAASSCRLGQPVRRAGSMAGYGKSAHGTAASSAPQVTTGSLARLHWQGHAPYTRHQDFLTNLCTANSLINFYDTPDTYKNMHVKLLFFLKNFSMFSWFDNWSAVSGFLLLLVGGVLLSQHVIRCEKKMHFYYTIYNWRDEFAA